MIFFRQKFAVSEFNRNKVKVDDDVYLTNYDDTVILVDCLNGIVYTPKKPRSCMIKCEGNKILMKGKKSETWTEVYSTDTGFQFGIFDMKSKHPIHSSKNSQSLLLSYNGVFFISVHAVIATMYYGEIVKCAVGQTLAVRPLVIHHKNGNHHDNRIANLEILTHKEHLEKEKILRQARKDRKKLNSDLIQAY